MARVKVRMARKDYPDAGIKKGEKYYTWQLYRQPARKSKTPPRRSQLTGSSFLGQAYDLIDISLKEADTPDDFKAVAEEIRSLGVECQGNLDNMPEQLHEAEAGQTLQTRIESCEQFATAIEEAADELESKLDDEDLSDEEKQEAVETCREECEGNEPDWG